MKKILSIEEAKKFIKDEEIDCKRLEELVGSKNSGDSMIAFHLVYNIVEKAKSEASRMEFSCKPQAEIYEMLDFYCDLIYVIHDQMYNYKYPKERMDTVDAGAAKLRAIMDKYDPKQQSNPESSFQAASSKNTQSSLGMNYNAQQASSKISHVQGSRPASTKQTSSNKVWSTKDKNNIDRLINNFNSRQKKQ